MRLSGKVLQMDAMSCRSAACAALTAVVSLLSACGGDVDNGDTANTTPPVTGDSSAPQDRAGVSFVDNLEQKVEDGEWTLGEGLVATLKLFAGEQAPNDVLRQSELEYAEGTGILAMARDYLAEEPDAGIKAEIERLLDRIVLSNERLETMAGIRDASAADGERTVQQAETDCLAFFEGYEIPAGVGPCLEVGISDFLDDLYADEFRVFFPAPSMPQGGWTNHHVQLTISALEDSVPVLRDLAEMPPVNIVLSFVNHELAVAQAWAWQDHLLTNTPPAPDFVPCNVVLYTSMQNLSDGDFKQDVAHELGHCWAGASFPEQSVVPYEYTKWWDEGIANYVSNLVYPDNNSEWGVPPARISRLNGLSVRELSTPLLERAYTNWIFFQYLENEIGNDGIITVLKSLPVSGDKSDQEAHLAAYPGMDELYHGFVKALTDGTVRDASGEMVPYPMNEFNRPTITVTGQYEIFEDLPPFGVSRFRLEVKPDKMTDLSFTGQGQYRESARPASGADWSAIPSVLPEDGQCQQDLIVAVTSTATADYEFSASNPRDVDSPDCDACLIGEWAVNNSDYGEMLSADPLYDYTVSGLLSVTFNGDGSAQWVLAGLDQTATGLAGGPDPGRVYSTITSGGGIQAYNTRFEGLVSFEGPDFPVAFTQTGVEQSLQATMATGFGDLQTAFFYECNGDELTMIVVSPYAGDFEIGWMRVR